MAPRVALNMVYAHLMQGLDAKQRRQLDDELYGWAAENQRANQALLEPETDGGGDG